MKTQELQTIRGYIRAVPRTPGKEDAIKVAIVAEDGTEYHVLHKSAGMDLADFISADIEVTGLVSPLEAPDDEGQAFLLTVRSYHLTDGFDDPWYDDDA